MGSDFNDCLVVKYDYFMIDKIRGIVAKNRTLYPYSSHLSLPSRDFRLTTYTIRIAFDFVFALIPILRTGLSI